tara:strand:+ start:1562 stop:2935 length:1374 start_codon:yes stop_codon:yes gene_type:complete
MCGISGIIDSSNSIVDELYKSLFYLQHRGQHSSGFIFFSSLTKRTFKSKKMGLINSHIEDLKNFSGNMGIAHVRYPTSGSNSRNEIQPFSILKPYGISLVHNGNLTNKEEIVEFLNAHQIYANSTSDSELILNLFYHFIEKDFSLLANDDIVNTISQICQICKGSFSVIIMISDYGLIGFRDKYGIRPLSYSKSDSSVSIASETNAFYNHEHFEDIKNGEIMVVNTKLEIFKKQLFKEPLKPCIFEYIYFANPESYINDILVYSFREKIAEKVVKLLDNNTIKKIDIVVPIPMTSIITATAVGYLINKPIKHAVVKNRYTHRTFINQGNEILKNISKIKVMHSLIENKNILVIDDSIVRGNTCKHIIKELRKGNPKKITFISCSPPVRYPNIYGISIPTYDELIAHERSIEEIRKELDIDELFYLSLDSIKEVLNNLNPSIQQFEDSSFTGQYITNE